MHGQRRRRGGWLRHFIKRNRRHFLFLCSLILLAAFGLLLVYVIMNPGFIDRRPQLIQEEE